VGNRIRELQRSAKKRPRYFGGRFMLYIFFAVLYHKGSSPAHCFVFLLCFVGGTSFSNACQ
jgi:hypothetical protein